MLVIAGCGEGENEQGTINFEWKISNFMEEKIIALVSCLTCYRICYTELFIFLTSLNI